MIPKIIHYCWFGDSELPHESKVFIAEWKEFNPDWTLVLWNEENSPMDVPYMQKAHQEKMWANISNFIRLHALKEQGGIYMDTDVKLIKPLESLLADTCFFGFEEGDENSEVFWVNNAISGSEKGHPFILECFDALLEKFDGTEMSNLSGPRLTTDLLRANKGLIRYGYQHLDDITLYPKEFFYPVHYSEVYKLADLGKYIYPETIAVHVWARTWLPREILLRIIDDLYESIHGQQLEITRLLSSGTAGSSENELLGYLKQIAGSQYFYSRSLRKFEEELRSEKTAQFRMVTEQNSLQQSEIVGLREKMDQFLKREKELTEWISDLREITKHQSIENLELKGQLEILNQKDERLREELKHAENKGLQADLLSQERLELQQTRFAELQQKFAERQEVFIELQGRLIELQQRFTETHRKSTEHQEKYNGLWEKFSLLQESTAEVRKEYAELQASAADLRERLAEREERVEEIRQTLDMSRVELSLANANLNLANANLDLTNTNLDKARSDYEQQISALKNEIHLLNKHITWYHYTYEARSLAGLLKDRLKKPFAKKPGSEKKLPESADLQSRIKRYINNNHLAVKRYSHMEPVSIIMLSYNRMEDTQKAVKNIYKYTTTPFELIILDNNSTEEVRTELKQMVNKYDNLRIILETVNLGCAKGRMKAKRYAKYEYLLFLDNDILVMPYYLENLFSTLARSGDAAGVCCKVVFPNGKIQFNGGKMIIDDQYALYSLHDEGAGFDDDATNRFMECEWIPGGATLWKKDIFNKFGIDEGMKGSFEDNEISLRITKAGYKLLNSPTAIVIHDHYDFKDETYKKKQSEYFAARNNASRIQDALIYFYQKHHLIFSFAWKNNPWDIIWGLTNKDDIKAFIQENT